MGLRNPGRSACLVTSSRIAAMVKQITGTKTPQMTSRIEGSVNQDPAWCSTMAEGQDSLGTRLSYFVSL